MSTAISQSADLLLTSADQTNPNQISRDTETENDETAALNNPVGNILVVGATGLIGSRIVKALSRISSPDTKIYILCRDKFNTPETPNVIVKVCEAATWPAEIAKIPNLKTVCTALGARPWHRFLLRFTPCTDEFYLVNHNLNYQVALAARQAKVTNFVLISDNNVNYPIPKLAFSKTILQAAIERDISALYFPHLLILRPGPVIGIRAKHGSLKNFSLFSILDSISVLSVAPEIFTDWIRPLNMLSFATSVGKTAAIAIHDDDYDPPSIRIYGPWDIIYASLRFNNQIVQRSWAELKTIGNLSASESEKMESLTKLYKLLLGERPAGSCLG